jgi:hypothetical protein
MMVVSDHHACKCDIRSGGERRRSHLRASTLASRSFTEDLITTLSRMSGLCLITRYSSFRYKDKTVKTAHVSQELGVRVHDLDRGIG